MVRYFFASPAFRVLALLLAGCAVAAAQDIGTLNPQPLPPLAHPNDPKTPAKDLFARKTTAAPLEARSIGYYTHGCLAGGVALPVNGETWQVMRVSRNRNWGHPNLIALIERLAAKAPSFGWHGLLIGDMAQPRGGPMYDGHWSHQVGLDVDIWLTPMPDHPISLQEREEMMATNVVAIDWKDVDPKVWSQKYVDLLKAAAEEPEVERVLVNPAIKKAVCRDVKGDRDWLNKIRPFWGHNWHFHVRIRCPKDSPGCKAQPAPPPGDGCGKPLHWWLARARAPKTGGKRKPLLMSALPKACRKVLSAE